MWARLFVGCVLAVGVFERLLVESCWSVEVGVGNREALSLHLSLFARSLEAGRGEHPQPAVEGGPLAPEVVEDFEERLAAIARSPQQAQLGLALQQLVGDLLIAAGANVEAEHAQSDVRFDAAFIPGEEERIGLLVVEVKDRLTRESRAAAEHQLQSYVADARAGLGLLLYVSSTRARSASTTPLILSMSIEELLGELRVVPLRTVLHRARNRAAHSA